MAFQEFTGELDKTPSFDTPLSAQDEAKFQTWKKKYAPQDSGMDYDLRGAYKAGLTPDPQTGHWPDTFKKPNHPTFSNESIYAQYGNPGSWNGDTYIPGNKQEAGFQEFTGKLDKKNPSFLDEHPNLQTALQIGVPLASSVAGGLAVAPFTAGLSTIPAVSLLLAGQGLGGLLGESANQATGVSPHDPNAMALETVAPMIGEPLGRFFRGFAKFFPGFGEAARGTITPEMRNLPQTLFPGNSKAAYQALDAATARTNPHIMQFPNLDQAVQDLGKQADEVPWDQLRSKLRLNGQEDLFDQIAGTLKGSPAKTAQVSPTVGGKSLQTGLPKQTVVTSPARPPGLDFSEARAASEGLNKIIMSTSDPKERGVYTKLRGALLDDIENAPRPPGTPTDLWNKARMAAKNENARAKLSQATEQAITTKDGVDIVDPNKIVKYLRTSDDIKSRVSPAEYRDILNTYRGMSSMVGHNLGKFWGMILGSATGSAIGAMTGGSTGALAGLGAGPMGYAAAEGLSRAMLTERGRQWVRAMMNNPTTTNFRRGMSALGAGFSAAIPDREGE